MLLSTSNPTVNNKVASRYQKKTLIPRYLGPYRITAKHGEVAYTLQLPPQLANIHPTFHVSNLKKWNEPPTDQRQSRPRIPLRINRRTWRHQVDRVWHRELKDGEWHYTITTIDHPEAVNKILVPRSEPIYNHRLHPKIVAYESRTTSSSSSSTAHPRSQLPQVVTNSSNAPIGFRSPR